MTENKGDLISRSELKKAIEKYRPISTVKSTFIDGRHSMFMDCIIEIDKAPTVELTEEQAIDKLNETGWLIRHDKEMTERPQGEWNYIQAGMCVCPFCGAIPHKLYKNYCAKCGADMRKEDSGND